ncbi:MAG: ATP synthase F1 delta subunit [Alteromonas naphthalenivorans]|jgi:ATP synthase F1 delta subunit
MNRVANTLARRYARAFLNTFSDQVIAANLKNFKKAADYLKERPHAFFLMELSLLPDKVKVDAIDTLCNTFDLPVGCKKLCLLLIKDQRVSLLRDIFIFIVSLKEQALNIIHFDVASSHVLLETQKKEIKQFLDTHVQGTVSCNYTIDESLIAGIRLQSSSLLWEKSVKKRLASLAQALQ